MNIVLQALMKFFGGASEFTPVVPPDSLVQDTIQISRGSFQDTIVIDTMAADVAQDTINIVALIQDTINITRR